jgi:hypothetical protein
MQRVRVAIVSRDPESRLVAARAFDSAPSHWEVDLYEDPPVECDHLVFGDDVVAPPGDMRIDPARPEGIVEQIASRIPLGRARSLFVSSACGGTGCTSIALHLAAEFSKTKSACAVDLRGGMADRLGIDADAARTWDDAGALDEIELCALPVAGGFRALLKADTTAKVTPDLVGAVETRFDRVVLDASAPDASKLLGAGGTLVLVTSGSAVAARRTARLWKRLPDCRLAIVVNRVGRGGQTTRAELERIIGRRVTLELPHCPALRDVEDEARLLASPVHRWMRGLERLARAL